jgi:hypothetical protein
MSTAISPSFAQNFSKLNTLCKKIHCPISITTSITPTSTPSDFLALLNYALLFAFPSFASFIVSSSNKSFADILVKKDVSFISTLYRLLLEIFSYKPSITQNQFFSNGFVEQKIILCCNVIELISSHPTSKGNKKTKKVSEDRKSWLVEIDVNKVEILTNRIEELESLVEKMTERIDANQYVLERILEALGESIDSHHE